MDAEDEDYVCTLSPPSLKKAEIELNEDPSQRLHAVKSFRDWIKAQPHINFPKLETKTMLMFLRGCKFNQQRAQNMIEGYLRLKNIAPEWFLDIDTYDSLLHEVIDTGYVFPLPKCTEDGCGILVYKLGAIDPSKHGYTEMIRTSMAVSTLLLKSEDINVNGTVFIFDFSDFTMSHMARLCDRKAMCQWNKMWQKTMPIRIKAFHYYNAGFFFKIMMTFSRPFLPKKFQERIKLHSSLSSLHKHVSPELLPDEYQVSKDSTTNLPIEGILKNVKSQIQDPVFHDDLAYFSSSEFSIDDEQKSKQTSA